MPNQQIYQFSFFSINLVKKALIAKLKSQTYKGVQQTDFQIVFILETINQKHKSIRMSSNSVIYFLLLSCRHSGDYAQAVEVQRQLSEGKHSNAYKAECHFVDIEKVENNAEVQKGKSKRTNILMNELETMFLKCISHQQNPQSINYRAIIHSFGQKGLYYLASLQEQNNNNLKQPFQKISNQKRLSFFTIVQIYQHFDIILKVRPNMLIIPKATSRPDLYNLCQKQQNIRNLQTHCYFTKNIMFEMLSVERLKLQYDQCYGLNSQVDLKQSYIIVMLAGDAPEQENRRYFTKQSAEELLKKTIKLKNALEKQHKKKYRIIVQNGPRTGKYDQSTGKENLVHMYNKGENQDDAVDQISAYFISRLKQEGINKEEYLFFNFAFEMTSEGRNIITYYKPLLYLFCKLKSCESSQSFMPQSNYFLFPAQSTSMCSQLPYYVDSSRLIIYYPSSANEYHIKIAEEFFNQGRFRKFVEDRRNERNQGDNKKGNQNSQHLALGKSKQQQINLQKSQKQQQITLLTQQVSSNSNDDKYDKAQDILSQIWKVYYK